MKRRQVLAIGALGAVGIGTGASFANSSSSSSFGLDGEDVDFGSVQNQEDFSHTGPHDGPPSISAVTGSARSITEGDVLFVDEFTPDSDAVWFNLLINNAGALSQDFNYLNFEIGVHLTNVAAPSDTEWDDVTDEVGLSTLSLTRGDITFIIEDSTAIMEDSAVDNTYAWADIEHVAITVEGGSSYIYTGGDPDEIEFFLEGRAL